MKANISHKNLSGIYLIRNILNGKVYIGKSVNIYARVKRHISSLTLAKKHEENQHLINAWLKYGKENFSYCVVEVCKQEQLKERELFWMTYYGAINPKLGYNKRLDSSGGMIPHKETIKKLSDAQNKRFSDPKERLKVSKRSKKFWKENPDRKREMSLKLKELKQKYTFLQLSEEGVLIKEYNTVDDIIKENPTYKWQNIYSVCNGYKKRIYGYKWEKKLKI